MRHPIRLRWLIPGTMLLILGGARSSLAQEVAIKAGLDTGSLSFDKGEGASRQGWIAGASVFLLGADRGGWQMEALVVQKGGRDLLRAGDEVQLTYLEIPVVLHADVWQRRASAVYFAIGPSLAVNLHSSYAAGGAEEDISDDVSRFDFGLTFGGGVELGPLVLDARYIVGLRSALTTEAMVFRNRTFAVTAGLRFR